MKEKGERKRERVRKRLEMKVILCYCEENPYEGGREVQAKVACVVGG